MNKNLHLEIIGLSFVAILVLSQLSVFLIVPHTEAMEPVWNIQAVDEKALLDGGISLALDSNDNPHLCYIDSENGHYHDGYNSDNIRMLSTLYITYASWNGFNWNIQKIDTIPPYPAPGPVVKIGYTALALDSNNRPYVVYSVLDSNEGGFFLKQAHWTGSNWTIQTIDHGKGGSIALDSAGNPQIAYQGADNSLKFGRWSGSNWEIQTVDTEGSTSLQYLTLDSNDNPCILYGRRFDNGFTVKTAQRNPSGWNIQTLLSNTSVLSFGNIVLDSHGNPHFTYSDGATYYPHPMVMYNRWNGSAWNAQDVTPVSNVFSDSYLTLDSKDNAHITYTNNTDNHFTVEYATSFGESWSIQTVDSDIYERGNPMPLALDSKGNPHICYIRLRDTGRYYVDGTVRYATANASALPTPTPPPSQSYSPTILLVGTITVLTVATVAALVYFRSKKGEYHEKENVHSPDAHIDDS
jgi:hypothetical protein